MNDYETIRRHYEDCWGAPCNQTQWKLGPTWQMPPGFSILVFPKTERRKMWTYSTCGMSQQSDAIPVELHLFSPSQTEAHVELLTVIAHYHLTGDYLDLAHTVNFGRPWLVGSTCDHGLVSPPYLDGPRLEWLMLGDRKIRFLWLIPITRSEVAFKQKNGLLALEERFETVGFNYLNPLRDSVVS